VRTAFSENKVSNVGLVRHLKLVIQLFDKMCIMLNDFWKQKFELLKTLRMTEWLQSSELCRYVAFHENTNIKQTSFILPGNTKDKCSNVS